MSLAGDAAIVIWNDVTVESQKDFLAWHNREHIPERVAIPGFLRGRRCRATAAGPQFLTLYEVAGIGILKGGHYLDRLNSPSAWTQRMLPQFRNTARSLCRVEISVGGGIGGFVCTVRSNGELRPDREALESFRVFARNLIGESADVLGAHLLARDVESSSQKMAEKSFRTESVAMPATILLTEGTVEDAVAAAAGALTDELNRLGLTSTDDAVTGVYRHELCLTAADCDPPGLSPS